MVVAGWHFMPVGHHEGDTKAASTKNASGFCCAKLFSRRNEIIRFFSVLLAARYEASIPEGMLVAVAGGLLADVAGAAGHRLPGPHRLGQGLVSLEVMPAYGRGAAHLLE
jgi:hypothetical protein